MKNRINSQNNSNNDYKIIITDKFTEFISDLPPTQLKY